MLIRTSQDARLAGDHLVEPEVRVLLADPDPISRHVLGSALREVGRFPVDCVDSRRPLREWPLDGMNVAVLVVGPQEDLTPAVRELVARKLRVLLLGVGWTRERLSAALAAGASGCLVKDTQVAGLAPAAQAVASGHMVLSPELLCLYAGPGAGAVDGEHRPPSTDRLLGSLTGRESEVLSLLAGGMSTAEVAARLQVSPATIKSHVSHALTKLRARNRLEAVLMMRRMLDAGRG